MKALFWQFSRFFIVGASSALVQFTCLIGLVQLYAVKPIVASTLGYLSGALINYLLNHYFTFKSTLAHRYALLRFSANSFLGICVNFAMMTFLLGYYSYIFCQILTSAVILVWNFLLHRYWTFQSKPDEFK